MSTPLYVCIRVPEFAAQALIRLRPQLTTRPVAVLEGEPPFEKTCSVTLQARRLGVQHGMTRTELESFPHLTVLRRSLSEETYATLALLDMASRFTPRTEELPRSSAFTLALDVSGSTRLWGPPHVLGQKLFRAARELGFFARITSSCNLHTAVCLARARGNIVVAVPPGEERSYLEPLPLSALDLTPELAETFAAWGVRTAGELAALTPAHLVARLGQQGHRLHRLATGCEQHLLVPAEPAFTLQEHLALEFPVDNIESLLFVLAPMLDQLLHRARERALSLASVTTHLHLERAADQTDRTLTEPSRASDIELDEPTHVRMLKPALPLDDLTLLLKLLQLDLQAHPAPAAIVAVTLRAEPGPRPGVQSGLFSPQSPEPMRLEVTLARIAAIVGEDRVGRAVLSDSHAPEAFRLDRFKVAAEAGSTQRPCRASAPGRVETSHTGVALRRLRPSPRVEVTSADGRPYRLRVFASNFPTRLIVQKAFGPWRRSGQWWSSAVWSFEEWDIDAHSEDGFRLLAVLMHNRLAKQWQMVAVYD